MFIFFPSIYHRQPWAARLDSGFEAAHPSGALGSPSPSPVPKAEVCQGLARISSRNPRMCLLQSFISLSAREVTNHHPAPFKQLGALNCASYSQAPSTPISQSQARYVDKEIV